MRVETPSPQQTAEELERFFGPDGGMARNYGGKSRWSQVEMALTINRAFHESRSMLVEAPTGTGKTLAYLIPAALCMRNQPKQRFVISVATKNLQSQIERDLERFAAEFPELKQSAVLKGAGNYLCLNRLRRAANRPHYNRQVEEEFKQLVAGFEALEKLPHGWREELPIKVSDQTWSAINGEGTCCRSVCGCYRRQAKKLAAKAKLVVVNSDLLGYNIKYTGKPIPSEKDTEDLKPILILDEAHTLLGRLTEVESADVSFRTLEGAVHILTRDSTGEHNHLKPRIAAVAERLQTIRDYLAVGPEGQQVVTPEDPSGRISRELVTSIRQIRDMAVLLKRVAPSEEFRQDYQELESRLSFSGQTLATYLDKKLPNYTMLLNRTASSNGHAAIHLELKPFDLEPALEKLWSHFQQVTLISATLVGTSISETKKTFNARAWGAANFPSPFCYKKQMRVFLPPKTGTVSETPLIAENVKRAASITDGRVLALFTNYKAIQEVHTMIKDWCQENGYQLYTQERNVSPETIVEKYSREPRAIILGNQSMGTGIDIRLRALIITKIPFDQQTPYREARQKYLEGRGVNPFRDDTLPEAVRKWKQWWGRLIREEKQKGLLFLLDPKLNSANYNTYFLKNLPQDVRATHLDDPDYPLPTRDQFLQWYMEGEKKPEQALSLNTID